MSEEQTGEDTTVAGTPVMAQPPAQTASVPATEEEDTGETSTPTGEEGGEDTTPGVVVDEDLLETATFTVGNKPVTDDDWVEVKINDPTTKQDITIDELNLLECLKYIITKQRKTYLNSKLDDLDMVKHPPEEDKEEPEPEGTEEEPTGDGQITKKQWEALMKLEVGDKYTDGTTIKSIKDNPKAGVRNIKCGNGTIQIPLKF